MNQLVGEHLIDGDAPAGDRGPRSPGGSGLGKDPQVVATAAARRFLGDRLLRVVSPHELLDPKVPRAGRAGSGGPLVAIRLHVLTRKTLGGLETDLDGRVLRPDGSALSGVYAVGEVAGFGGGGVRLPAPKAPSWAAACSRAAPPAEPGRQPLIPSLTRTRVRLRAPFRLYTYGSLEAFWLRRGLVVAYHLGNDKVQEFLGELGIKPGVLGQGPQSLDLLGLTYGIGGR